MSSSSSAYILQKGAEVMSMIKAPFKRKSMPPMNLTVTPEKTPRAKRASSASRSMHSNSLAASSVNSLSDGQTGGVEAKDSSDSPGFVRVSSCAASTNPIVVMIDGEEVLIRDKEGKSVSTAAASVSSTNPSTIEVDDSEAFPEELMTNDSKNNLLTINSVEELINGKDENNKSVSDYDDNENGNNIQGVDGDHIEEDSDKVKTEDQVTRSVKVARLKKKLRTKVLGLSNQLKETQQMSTENGNEMANKMLKYFSKVDTMENDKLISDDACSSKMNSPVHQVISTGPAIISPTGAKRKQKSKKSKLRIKSPIAMEKNRSKDDHLIVGEETPNKSIRNVIFSSFRNYTKSSNTVEDLQVSTNNKKEDIEESDYLQPIEVKQKADKVKVKSTMRKNIKSKFKRFNIGQSVDKLKVCKTCEKKCRKIHPSRTVLDFKKEFKTDELFESEFCTCTNSISIKNFNDDYFEEIDDEDLEDDDINIKNHLYSEIDGVSKTEVLNYNCTGHVAKRNDLHNFRLCHYIHFSHF